MGLVLKAFLGLLIYCLGSLYVPSLQVPSFWVFFVPFFFLIIFYLGSSLSYKALLDAASNHQHVQSTQAWQARHLPFKSSPVGFTKCVAPCTLRNAGFPVSSSTFLAACCVTGRPILDFVMAALHLKAPISVFICIYSVFIMLAAVIETVTELENFEIL